MILFELIVRILLLEQIGLFVNFLFQKVRDRNLTLKNFRKSGKKDEYFDYKNRIVGIIFLMSVIVVLMLLQKAGMIIL